MIKEKESYQILPDNKGYFGAFGGRFVPETLVPAINELSAAYECAKMDSSFWNEFNLLSHNYSGIVAAPESCSRERT
jgi:tryptophan synthase beta subunit